MITTLKQSRECSIEEFNKLLEQAQLFSSIKIKKDKEDFINAKLIFNKRTFTYIYEVPNHSLIYIKIKFENKYQIFHTNLNNSIANGNMYKKWSIIECIRNFQKTFNRNKALCNYVEEENLIENNLSYVDNMNNKITTYVNNAGIIITKQGNYNNFTEYDLKSAWLTFLAQEKLPYVPVITEYREYIDSKGNKIIKPYYKLDLEKCYYKDKKIVGKNQIGFVYSNRNFTKQYLIVKSGEYANYIFDLVDNKKRKELLELKEKISKTTNKIDRNNLKNMVNLWIGNLTHHNPFLRSYVIQCCNEYIENIIKKNKNNFIYSVTDSIGLIKQNEELENNPLFSKKLNNYKVLVKDNNRFYYDNNGIIQKVTIRGISGAKFIGEHINNIDKCYNKPNIYKLSIIKDKYMLVENKIKE